MKWILYTLLATAACLLIAPALLLGSFLYALAAAVFTGVGAFVLHKWPESRISDVALIALCVLPVASRFVGIHPLFPIIALMLFVYAWNAAHRFGHLDRADVEADARRQFIIQTLTFSLIPSAAAGLFLVAFLYVRFSMPFGLGLGLSIAVLISVALFMGLARAVGNRE